MGVTAGDLPCPLPPMPWSGKGQGNMTFLSHPLPPATDKRTSLGGTRKKLTLPLSKCSRPTPHLANSRPGPNDMSVGELDPRVGKEENWPQFLLSATLGGLVQVVTMREAGRLTNPATASSTDCWSM